MPAVEKAFDQEFGDEEVIHLTRIDLDLGLITDAQIGRLPELIHQQLVEKLRNIAISRSSSEERKAPQVRSDKRQSRLTTLLHYLRTGSLPWEAVRTADETPKVVQGMKQTCSEQWDEVQQTLRREQLPMACFFRLLQLIGPAEAHRLPVLLKNDVSPNPAVVELVMLLMELSQKASSSYRYLELAALVLSEAICSSAETPAFEELGSAISENRHLQEFVGSLPPRARVLLHEELKVSLPPVSHSIIPGRSFSALEGANVKRGQQEPCHTPSSPAPSPTEELFKPASETELISSNPNATEDFARVVSHAGLVLLHPFLSRLFEATGIKAKDESWLSWVALPRAAALLSYLATGREEIYEHDIALIKVLLEIQPVAALCVSEGLLADDDKSEADALLAAAIKHWPALRDTSIAAFRSSFLQRMALLREDDNGWRLQVERQPFDMLIEHLPWSISVVKLPWMKRPLYTEW